MEIKRVMLIFAMIILIQQVCAQEAGGVIVPPEEDDTNIIEDISIDKIIPSEFSVGDVQFSLKVRNNKNESLLNLIAFISGKGFSTYDVVPIEILEPKEQGYILISGNFKESGNINLTIRILNIITYKEVNVSGTSAKDLEELKKKEEEKKMLIENLTKELNAFVDNFNKLEDEILVKKSEYDLSRVNLNNLDRYIKNTQSSILAEDADGAKLNLNLAANEYNIQKIKLENAPEIPLISKVRENAIIFSTIAGSIITFFALYELLKRKEERVVEHIKKIGRKKKKKSK